MDELLGVARVAARHRHRRLRARRGEVRARCCASPSTSTCRSRSSSWSVARTSSAISPRWPQACATFAPKSTLAACVDRMRADKPAGGTVEGARAQLAAAAPVRARQEDRHDPEPGAGAGRRSRRRTIAAISPTSAFRAVREPGREGHLLRRAAGPEVERGRTQCLPARQGLPAVRVGARSVAGTLPAVAVRQRESVASRGAVVGLRLRRGLGALHRRDDVRRGPRRRPAARCASAC